MKLLRLSFLVIGCVGLSTEVAWGMDEEKSVTRIEASSTQIKTMTEVLNKRPPLPFTSSANIETWDVKAEEANVLTWIKDAKTLTWMNEAGMFLDSYDTNNLEATPKTANSYLSLRIALESCKILAAQPQYFSSSEINKNIDIVIAWFERMHECIKDYDTHNPGIAWRVTDLCLAARTMRKIIMQKFNEAR